jgi:hypothetical protein
MAQAIANRNFQSIEAAKPDLFAARELSMRKSSMVEGGWLPEPLPAGIRTMLERRQTAVMAGLQAASRGELEEEVASLMTGFPSMRGLSKLEAQILVRKYADDLAGMPLWAIRAACRDISRGAVSDLNPDFPPSASRVRQQADEHLERVEREAKDLRNVLTAKVLPPELPAEKKDQIILGFQKLHESCQRYSPPPEPIKPPPPQAPSKTVLEDHYATHRLGFRSRDDG